MAGFGGGHGGGHHSSGGHHSGGFGGGHGPTRSTRTSFTTSGGHTYSRSYSGSPRPYNRPPMRFWGPRWYCYTPGYGYSYGSFMAGRIFAMLVMGAMGAAFIYGGYRMSIRNKYVESTYIITSKSDRLFDEYGPYYEYGFKYDYKGVTYTVSNWKDDYAYTQVGDTGTIYVNSKDVTDFAFENPSVDPMAYWSLYTIGGICSVTFIASTFNFITHKHREETVTTEY